MRSASLVALASLASVCLPARATQRGEMHPPAPRLGAALANPVGIDPEVFCGINDLAYKWSIRALPERAPLVESFDSLRLGSECNRSRPSAGAAPRSLASRLPTHGRDYVFGPGALGAATAYYVDFSTGDDEGPGTAARPFQTAYRALGACRAFKADQADSVAPCQIVLRGGTQPFSRPLDLNAGDSGLTIAAFPGEQPEVSLGVELAGLQWEQAPGMTGFSAPKPGVNGVDGLASADPSGNITASVPGVTLLGRTGNTSGCQALCEKLPLCTSWTWHDAQQGAFALACLAHTDGVWQPTRQSGHTSGQRLNVWRADVSRFRLQPFAQLWRGKDGGFRRQSRARFPSANPEVFGLWTAPETGWVPAARAWAPPVARPDAVEVDISSPLNNGTHFPTFPMGVGGPGDGFFHPPRSYWTIKVSPSTRRAAFRGAAPVLDAPGHSARAALVPGCRVAKPALVPGCRGAKPALVPGCRVARAALVPGCRVARAALVPGCRVARAALVPGFPLFPHRRTPLEAGAQRTGCRPGSSGTRPRGRTRRGRTRRRGRAPSWALTRAGTGDLGSSRWTAWTKPQRPCRLAGGAFRRRGVPSPVVSGVLAVLAQCAVRRALRCGRALSPVLLNVQPKQPH